MINPIAAINNTANKLTAETAKTAQLAIASKRIETKKLKMIDQLQLPLFDDMRVNVGTLVRGALFNAKSSKQERKVITNQTVAMTGDITAIYTGVDLRQDENLLLGELLHLQKQFRYGEIIKASPLTLLKNLGWSDSPSSYARLFASLSYLKATCITIIEENTLTQEKEYKLGGKSLVESFDGNYIKGQLCGIWEIRITDQMSDLLTNKTATLIEHETRLGLSKTSSPLALWLHSYLSEFKEPRPLSITFYREQSGLSEQYPKLWRFKEALKRACDLLVEHKVLISYELGKDNLLHVKRSPRKQDKKTLTNEAD